MEFHQPQATAVVAIVKEASSEVDRELVQGLRSIAELGRVPNRDIGVHRYYRLGVSEYLDG